MKALVLGGTGTFGRIIAGTLARSGDFDVVVAGRDGAKGEAVAASLGAAFTRIDAAGPGLAERIAACAPRIVISTAGPFQGQDYRVARAAIAAGAHYVDIADGRDFVCGIGALDAAARAADVLVASGASSVPALTSAVIDAHAQRFARIDSIDMGISSSARLPGLATTQGVLRYCGKPLARWHDGSWSTVHGWQGLRRHRFREQRMTRWICDCDVPDLGLFPARYPGVRSVRFGAGVELAAVQWGLWGMAGAGRAGLVKDASRWAAILRRGAATLEGLGTGRSAMFVDIIGTGVDGSALRIEWELVAQDEEGINVPCMAAVALARKLAAGSATARGAVPCVGLISLDEYLFELRGLKVNARTDVRAST